MKKNKDQVSLFKLVFTHNWEDPLCDHAALKIKNTDSVMAITSGGCNVLGFLLFDPEIIYSVDINPSQSCLLELKMAAIKNLDFGEFILFSGLQSYDHRLQLYGKFKSDLSTAAQTFWNDHAQIIQKGF